MPKAAIKRVWLPVTIYDKDGLAIGVGIEDEAIVVEFDESIVLQEGDVLKIEPKVRFVDGT